MKRIYVGSELAKTYKTYETLKAANAAARKCGCYVARLHNVYYRNTFYGYIVVTL